VPFASSFFAALRLGSFGGANAIAQYNDWLVVGVLGHNAGQGWLSFTVVLSGETALGSE
jgi:hypothetical protein